jgi:hypothetical protein
MTLGAFTPRLATFALQVVDRSPHQWLVRDQRLDQGSNLHSKLDERLPEPRKLLLVHPALYAHNISAYSFEDKIQEKK